jgi:hypothetical protein
MATSPADDKTAVLPLEGSARHVLKGTLVRLRRTPVRRVEGHSLAKYGLVKQLHVTRGDADAVREQLQLPRGYLTVPDPTQDPAQRPTPAQATISPATLELLRAFEAPALPVLAPGVSEVAAVSADELGAFANALVKVRTAQLRAVQQDAPDSPELGMRMRSLQSAVVAAQGYAVNLGEQPIGMLNLERIEMVPAGLQRGELVATIPLAPGEETAVTHKEWSVTSKEFTTIVTDALEETSETGVTDNTDLAQSTTSQNQHSTQFNITGTVQGGIPMINGSSTAGVTAQDATSQSATDTPPRSRRRPRPARARNTRRRSPPPRSRARRKCPHAR